MIPGLPPLALNLNSTARSSGQADQFGNMFELGNSGAWNVNVSGSGQAVQGASSTAMPSWIWIAAVGLAALWLLKK